MKPIIIVITLFWPSHMIVYNVMIDQECKAQSMPSTNPNPHALRCCMSRTPQPGRQAECRAVLRHGWAFPAVWHSSGFPPCCWLFDPFTSFSQTAGVLFWPWVVGPEGFQNKSRETSSSNTNTDMFSSIGLFDEAFLFYSLIHAAILSFLLRTRNPQPSQLS